MKGDGFGTSEIAAFAARASFSGVPAATIDDLGEARVVIVGAPFDWGASHRPGARFGPKAIRDVGYLGFDGYRPHLATGIDSLSVLKVVDIGDLNLPPGYMDESLDRISAAIATIAQAGKIPMILGGDHTITYANCRALAAVHGDFALIHFDAHADTGAGTIGGMPHSHGTPMRKLIEEGHVAGRRFVQIGLRGYWPEPETVAWMAEQGMRSYLMTDIVERGLGTVVDEAVAYATDGVDKAFLSVDIDVVEPAMAPGTGTPEPGGLLPRELMDTLRRLARNVNVIGADIVEVSPPYDGVGDVTALLANRLVLEILNGMAERRLAT
ncbi:MAG: agmatinase [Acidimicrobiia bacterium]|nr:agmatinase [Acidimicrobiia bacterium]NND14425.1 agmatinase [Acidimicrobiia bacterium]NNL48860.1 agmatinase [Acidimicrobiia bacterium]